MHTSPTSLCTVCVLRYASQQLVNLVFHN